MSWGIIRSDKKYGFRFFSSSVRVLTTINDFAYQTLDTNGEARAVALDIS